MNSGNFKSDSYKSRSKQQNQNKNKNKQNEGKEEETVGAVIESTPITPTAEEPETTKNVSDSDMYPRAII